MFLQVHTTLNKYIQVYEYQSMKFDENKYVQVYNSTYMKKTSMYSIYKYVQLHT